MKGWIIAVLIIIVVGFISFSYYIYEAISAPMIERQQNVISLINNLEGIHEINNISHYHGRRSFQVFEGINDDDQEIYIWVEELKEEQKEENTEPQVITRLKSDGLTEQQVKDIVHGRLNINEIKSINLGIIGITPIYEVIYEDQSNRHSFYYITFEDGTYIRHYQFQKN
ncbi:MAG: DUF5590 domain-containing protein [Bacillus sp. (in: Bacteria)]|nr:DUF5590 domain-containing protein [Bacillus sp. (in: firmicutes)]